MIDHAWGRETCRMKDIKNYRTEEHSLSNGQVLMRNYEFEEGAVIAREMTDVLVLDLVDKGPGDKFCHSLDRIRPSA